MCLFYHQTVKLDLLWISTQMARVSLKHGCCLFVPALSARINWPIKSCSLVVITIGARCCRKPNLSTLRSGSFIPMAAPTLHSCPPSEQQPECEVNCMACRPPRSTDPGLATATLLPLLPAKRVEGMPESWDVSNGKTKPIWCSSCVAVWFPLLSHCFFIISRLV